MQSPKVCPVYIGKLDPCMPVTGQDQVRHKRHDNVMHVGDEELDGELEEDGEDEGKITLMRHQPIFVQQALLNLTKQNAHEPSCQPSKAGSALHACF